MSIQLFEIIFYNCILFEVEKIYLPNIRDFMHYK